MRVSHCALYKKRVVDTNLSSAHVISQYNVKEQYLISTDGHRKDVPTQVPCGKNPLVRNTHYHYSLRLSSHDIWPLISSLEAHLSHKPPLENTAATMTQRSALKQDVHMESWRERWDHKCLKANLVLISVSDCNKQRSCQKCTSH